MCAQALSPALSQREISAFGREAEGGGLSLVFAEFAIKRAGRDAENGRGPFAISIALAEHAQDVFSFEFFQSNRGRLRRRGRSPGRTTDGDSDGFRVEEGNLTRFDGVAQGDCGGAFEAIAQLAHVAGPGVTV